MELIATISKEDSRQMLQIFERKTGLENILNIAEPNPLVTDEALYEKFIKDYNTTVNDLQNYWNAMAEKYNFKSEKGKQWTIDFETQNIYLVEG